MKDLMTIVRADHREVKRLLTELADTEPGRGRRQMLAELEENLELHMQIEETLLYPHVEESEGSETREEAEVEHRLARDGLASAKELVDAPGFGASVEMLLAGIWHHVKEEESEILPALKRATPREQWNELSRRVAAAKEAGSVTELTNGSRADRAS